MLIIENSSQVLIVCVSLQILIELTDLCKSEDCAHEQRLLRNMGAHTVILELLQVPYNKVGGWVDVGVSVMV